jgi:hypothetical protein
MYTRSEQQLQHAAYIQPCPNSAFVPAAIDSHVFEKCTIAEAKSIVQPALAVAVVLSPAALRPI